MKKYLMSSLIISLMFSRQGFWAGRPAEEQKTIQHTAIHHSSQSQPPAIMSENTTPPSTPPPPPNPPVEFLTKRAGDMLRANPWLAGRLKTVEGQPHLEVSARPSSAWLSARRPRQLAQPSARIDSRPTRRAPHPGGGRGAPCCL